MSKNVCCLLLLFVVFGNYVASSTVPGTKEDPESFDFVFDNETIHQNSQYQLIYKLLSHLQTSVGNKAVTAEGVRGEKAKYCTECKIAIGALKAVLKSGIPEDMLANTLVTFCKILRISTSRVCDGFVEVFKDQVFYVMKRTDLSANDICGTLLGETCHKVISPHFSWGVHLPNIPKPPIKPIPQPNVGVSPLNVLHLTDIHYDPEYAEGMNSQCGEPLCCRVDDGPGDNAKGSKAGKWGDYHNCDTHMVTLQNMLNHIVANHKIDYIMWTGDVPPHDIWLSSKSENLKIVKTIADLLNSTFGGIPIYPSVGNHESVPVNSFPPPEVTGPFNISWLYGNLSETWGTWLPESTKTTIRKGGYYSVNPRPGFRLISLNSNYCNGLNWWLLLNATDPAQQLSWLVDELQDAESAGDKVHIISHIPPGKFDCVKSWGANYNKIINRYESTVTGQFFGHTHYDEFEIFYANETSDRATNVAYISPSVTTYLGVNPSYRIFKVDETSRAVLDHETYFINLTKANEEPSAALEWIKAYSAKDLYGMNTLQPQEWDKVVRRMQEDDNLFRIFYKLYTRGSDYEKQECTGKCKDDIICGLKTTISNDVSRCS